MNNPSIYSSPAYPLASTSVAGRPEMPAPTASPGPPDYLWGQDGLDWLFSQQWAACEDRPNGDYISPADAERMTCPVGWSCIFQSSHQYKWPSGAESPPIALTCCPPGADCKTLRANDQCGQYNEPSPSRSKVTVKGFAAPWRQCLQAANVCCPVGYRCRESSLSCELSEPHVFLRSSVPSTGSSNSDSSSDSTPSAPSASPSAVAAASSNSGASLPTGAIVGISIGAFAVIMVLGLLVLFGIRICSQRNARKNKPTTRTARSLPTTSTRHHRRDDGSSAIFLPSYWERSAQLSPTPQQPGAKSSEIVVSERQGSPHLAPPYTPPAAGDASLVSPMASFLQHDPFPGPPAHVPPTSYYNTGRDDVDNDDAVSEMSRDDGARSAPPAAWDGWSVSRVSQDSSHRR